MSDHSKLRATRPASPDAYPESSPRSGSGTAADPLAELARLIGQDDLFERMRQDAARAGHADAPSSSAAQATPEAPQWHGEDPRHQGLSGHDLRGTYEPDPVAPAYPAQEPHAAAPRRSYATPRPIEEVYDDQAAYPADGPDYLDEPYAEPAHGAPGYAQGHAAPHAAHAAYPVYEDAAYDPAYDYDDAAYDAGPAALERRRGGLLTLATVGGLAVLGTAGALGYWAFSGEKSVGEPPVITANPSPGKVTPAAPSRSETAERSRASGERVVPREEQPVELQQARTARTTTPGSLIGSPGQSTAAMVPPTVGGGNPDAPKRVKTIPIRPDGSIADPDRTQSIPTPGRAAPTAYAPGTRTAALPPTVAPAPPPAGTHVVQVASQRSEQDAHASFKALQAKYPQVLGGRDPLIRRIDLGDRGVFYRVQVGPFASADQANDLCGNLKAAGGQCIVQRN